MFKDNASERINKLFVYELCYGADWQNSSKEFYSMTKKCPQRALVIRIIFPNVLDYNEFSMAIKYISELTEDIFQNALIGNRTENEIVIVAFDETDGIDSRNRIVEKCSVLQERIVLILGKSPRIGIGGNKEFCNLHDSLVESGKALEESSLSIIHYEDKDTVIDGESSIVRTATEYIKANYTNQISLERVASEVCVSPNYLSAMLRAETGKSYVAYIMEIRLGKAKELLKNSEFTVKNIGEQVGYNDPLYFCRVFKKHTGMTPADYRNKASV